MTKMTPEQKIRFLKICSQLKENNPKMEWADLRFLSLGDDEAVHLTQSLAGNTTLRALDLSNNQIGEIGAKAVADFVKNSSLKKLNFASNRLGNEGALALARSLKGSSLQELCLGDNQIGDMGVNAFAEALKQNTSLTWLSFHGNQVGDNGAVALANSLNQNKTLTLLSLFHNKVGEQGGQAFVKVLDQNVAIQELFLQKNNVSENAQATIEQQLKLNRRLARVSGGQAAMIDISDVEVGATKQQFLTELRTKNPRLIVLDAENSLRTRVVATPHCRCI